MKTIFIEWETWHSLVLLGLFLLIAVLAWVFLMPLPEHRPINCDYCGNGKAKYKGVLDDETIVHVCKNCGAPTYT